MARFIEAQTGEQKPGVRDFPGVSGADKLLWREGRSITLYDLHTPLPKEVHSLHDLMAPGQKWLRRGGWSNTNLKHNPETGVLEVGPDLLS